jgi:hypothetical protein
MSEASIPSLIYLWNMVPLDGYGQPKERESVCAADTKRETEVYR